MRLTDLTELVPQNWIPGQYRLQQQARILDDRYSIERPSALEYTAQAGFIEFWLGRLTSRYAFRPRIIWSRLCR